MARAGQLPGGSRSGNCGANFTDEHRPSVSGDCVAPSTWASSRSKERSSGWSVYSARWSACAVPGHFYNWYNLSDLRVLEPAYISTVDSGNFAGHLMAIKQACLRDDTTA